MEKPLGFFGKWPGYETGIIRKLGYFLSVGMAATQESRDPGAARLLAESRLHHLSPGNAGASPVSGPKGM